MATLVLSTVGTMLGGPVGGAIGSLVGQGIDQQLFGPGPRHGPRLGDLSVQSSSYGSFIPKLFGTMRAAGTIIWSTDLQEQSQTQTAKGQPDSITYSYSASFAVALSSRPISGIGRIWADGKLIRNADGVFSVATGFRTYDGSEDQDPDPLIASIEGLGSAPAYRGLAMAVFENLDLAEFGNRIPFLTFEVIADPQPVAVGSVLGEISDGAIASSAEPQVGGYAAYGSSAKAAVEQLVEAYGIPLFDDGVVLSSPAPTQLPVGDEENGCSPDERSAPRIERSQLPAANLPSALTLSYYDPARDYQAGLARASLENRIESTEQVELPAALGAGQAKALAETSLARRWAERDRLRLRLPPRYLTLRPGMLLLMEADAALWRIERMLVDSMVVTVDLRPVYSAIEPLPADQGRLLPSAAIVSAPTDVVILELPDDGKGSANAPVVAVAAAGSGGRRVSLRVDVNGATSFVPSADVASTIGQAVTALASGQSALLDRQNSVDVKLGNSQKWLESRDAEALFAGANLALLGSEILQFGDAIPLGNGVFRLSRLLRGRRGTEWAMHSHVPGESFVILDPAQLTALVFDRSKIGAHIHVTPSGVGDDGLAFVDHVVNGEALRPPSPVHLRGSIDDAGNLACSWVRRSNSGWDWLDGVDAPLGCAAERYRVTLQGSAASLAIEASMPAAKFTPSQLAEVGNGELVLSVEQFGDFAVSRAAKLTMVI